MCIFLPVSHIPVQPLYRRWVLCIAGLLFVKKFLLLYGHVSCELRVRHVCPHVTNVLMFLDYCNKDARCWLSSTDSCSTVLYNIKVLCLTACFVCISVLFSTAGWITIPKGPCIRWGHAVAQLVEALRHKPEGRGFDYASGVIGIFFIDVILPAALWPWGRLSL